MNSEPGRISIVDDDESIRMATRALLRSVGYRVETFASAELLLESRALGNTDCFIVDIRMPGMDGLELQQRLNVAHSHVPLIFVTAHDDQLRQKKAIDGGAADFFRKPFDAAVFVAAVQAALRRAMNFEAPQPENIRALIAARLAPV